MQSAAPLSRTDQAAKPLVLLPACTRTRGSHTMHYVGNEYVEAVRLAGARPLVVPYALPEEIDALLDLSDGVLLTGSPSNVDAAHYGEVNRNPALPLDPLRDSWTLHLIPRALQRGIPLLAICRGFQETNVALGGSLHQAVHDVVGMQDHREPASAPVDVQYGPAHAVHVLPGGRLAACLGEGDIQVNSLHGQGIARLAEGLRREAVAPDGLVEAFSVEGSAGFNLAVQWHPEWAAASNPVSMKLLRAFAQACRARQQRMHPGPGCTPASGA